MFTLSRRRMSAMLAGLAATVLLAGCGVGADSSSSDDTLTLGDQANGLQTLMNAAGTLNGTPYHVKWAEFPGAAPLFQAMQGGTVDTGYAADLPTLQAISGNLPIKLVGALQNSGSNSAILVRDGSPIRSVAQLKGQTVMVSSARGSISEYLLATALQEAGLRFSDVKVQYVLPTAAQAAFNSGQSQVWATFDPYYAIGAGSGGRLLVDGTNGRTTGVGIISAANSSLRNPAKKAKITDFLRRLSEAETWATQHQDEYAQIYARTNKVTPEVAKEVVSRGRTGLGPVTPQIVTQAQHVADLMHQIGSLPSDVPVASTVDTSVYQPAAAPASPAPTH
jgi:sulfonate transport system substrate-binding protein